MARFSDRPPENRALGVVLVLTGTLLFTVSDAVAKLMIVAIPPIEVAWIRSVVVLVVTLPIARWRAGPRVFRPEDPVRQISRGAAVTLSSLLFLVGLAYLPLAENTAINFVYPLLITVLSAFFLGEKVGIRRWAATAIGFAGMLLIVRPGSVAFQSAAIFPLGAATFWAISSVMTRAMTANDPPETTILWTAFIVFLGSSALLPFVWVAPAPVDLARGVFVGICSALAHACFVFAFERASASTLAPFAYAQLVWATLIGFLFFASLPDGWIIAGSALIVASGIYTAHRERVRSQERAGAGIQPPRR